MTESKPDFLHRGVAKGIDFIIALMLSQHSFAGILAGCSYLLIADGFWEGQSFGKKLMKLRVLKLGDQNQTRAIHVKESILRNSVFAILLFLSCLPIIKYVAYLASLLVLAVELYFIYFDPKSLRLGDIYAETIVLNEKNQA